MTAAKLTRAQVFSRLVRDLGVVFELRKPFINGHSIYHCKWAARSQRYPGLVGTGSTKRWALDDLLVSLNERMMPALSRRGGQEQAAIWADDDAAKRRRQRGKRS